MAAERRQLGKTDIQITPIGLGCWQFGKSSGPMAFWNTPPMEEIDKIVKIAWDGGINWFDTAESYGGGSSERALAKALCKAGKAEEAVIATKWWPTTWIPGLNVPGIPRTAGSILKTISTRRECLAPCRVDLFQVHMPWSFSSIEAQMNAMAALVKAGKIRSVGVSNFSAVQMRRAHAALARHGIPLASNQVRFSLGYRNPEKNGVLEAARELNVTLIAYMPLGSGLLTGKFHNHPELVKKLPLARRRMMGRALERTRPLIKSLDEIGQAHGCSPAEVALSWVANFYGNTVVAIPGATKTEHVNQNIGALNLKLTVEEMAKLDALARSLSG